MVSRDLLSLGTQQQTRLRLIVAGTTRVAHELHPCVLRYDERLAGLATAPGGANAYFTQRALAHFAGLLTRHAQEDVDISTHRRWVETDLASAKPVEPPKRSVQTDQEVLHWIRQIDPSFTLSTTGLLRKFRQAGRACEQGRFRRLVEHSRRST
jgi:hypothetical protein